MAVPAHTMTRGRCAQPRYVSARQLVRNPTLVLSAASVVARALRDKRIVARSPVFDARWYLEQYPDVAAAGRDPVIHYLTIGASEGRDPGPDFSTTGYLTQYEDVAKAGMNPLVHYLRHGEAKGRSVSPSRRRGGDRGD